MRGDDTVWITGAAGDIGKEIVLNFLRKEYRVIAFDINEKELDNLNKLARKEQLLDRNRLVTETIDLRNKESLLDKVLTCSYKYGKPDVLVNCSGISIPRPLENLLDCEIDEMVSVNLVGIIFFTKAVLRIMTEGISSRSGCIINIASRLASNPMRNNAIYASTKSALISFSETIAMEYGDKGIRINCISPGLICSKMNEETRRSEEKLNSIMARQSIKRLGVPADVANLVSFLSSPESSFITGTDIRIDGGLS